MVDKLSHEDRSENMRRIRSKNTAPELAVRRYVHGAQLRYQLHRRNLAGCPDLVFPSRRICVFVNGCFWHGCSKCVDGRRAVKSNRVYWTAKVRGNRKRDKRNQKALEADGWGVLTIWECETSDPAHLAALVEAIRAAPPSPRRARTNLRPAGGGRSRDGAAA